MFQRSILNLLETTVFEHKTHWDAFLGVVEKAYPNLWETQLVLFPDLDIKEQKVLLLSRFRLSRMKEATLLDITVPMLDKIRGRARKKTRQKTIIN